MPDEEIEEPAAPAFFLSYARAQASSHSVGFPSDFNDPVKRLFRDLSARVNQVIRLPVGVDPGFLDVNAETGVLWEPELLRKVGSCSVFVALLSEPYLYDSTWCPMEWHLFRRRKVQARPGRSLVSPYASAMLPVIWVPIDREYPAAVKDVQRFMPNDLPPQYLSLYMTDGLLGAGDIDHDAYTAIVWKIARQIQIIRASCHVTPLIEKDPSGLPATFWGGGGTS